MKGIYKDEDDDGIYLENCTIDSWFDAFEHGYFESEWIRMYENTRTWLKKEMNLSFWRRINSY